MIYFPVKYPEGFWDPAALDVTVEDCFFTADDGAQLHGWLALREGARQTLIWCHGNAGNITYRLENLKMVLERINVNVFLFDYRGYGRSQGKPSEEGLYRDARAAYDYLVSEKGVDVNQIILFGRSLGGAVAVDLALNRYAAGLILESSFSSARDMAREVFPFLPVQYFLGVRFDSEAKIKKLDLPILVMHGTRDEVVPLELGRKLFAAAPQPKEFFTIDGAGHNDTYERGGESYFARIREFVTRVGVSR